MVDLELQLPEVEGIEIWLPKRRQTYQRGFITRVGER